MDSKSDTELLQPLFSDGTHSMCAFHFPLHPLQAQEKGHALHQKNRPINTSLWLFSVCYSAVDLNFKDFCFYGSLKT